MSEKVLASGIYFNERNPKAPDWVLGRISVNAGKFIDWLNDQTPNERNYVNMQILMSKAGKPYIVLDDYQKPQQSQPRSEAAQAYASRDSEPYSDEIPFMTHERGWLV